MDALDAPSRGYLWGGCASPSEPSCQAMRGMYVLCARLPARYVRVVLQIKQVRQRETRTRGGEGAGRSHDGAARVMRAWGRVASLPTNATVLLAPADCRCWRNAPQRSLTTRPTTWRGVPSDPTRGPLPPHHHRPPPQPASMSPTSSGMPIAKANHQHRSTESPPALSPRLCFNVSFIICSLLVATWV